MALGWTLALLVPLILVLAAESATLSGCGNFVEGVDDPDIYCDADDTSTVNWTLVTEAGVTRYLGSCHGEFNCSSPYNSSTVDLPYYYTYSTIAFRNIGVEFSGNVTCQEVTTDGTVDSDTCEINVVRVDIKRSDVKDGESDYSLCYNYQATPSTVRWTLVTDSGQTLDLGTCDDVNSCTSPLSPDITLTRTHDYYSRVDFRNVHRNLTGQLSCSYTYNGSTQTDTQTLNVYHRPTIENCSVDIRGGMYESLHNLSAVLSCNITRVFSSAGLYEFRVYRETSDGNGYMFEGRRSYSNGLTSYVNTSDNQVYYNGSLTYSWRLPHSPVRYTAFRVYVYYGYSVYRSYYITKDVVNGAKITHKADVKDGGSGYSVCYTHDATPSTVRWTLVTDSGQTLHLGTCDDVNSCTSPLSPDINLTRPDSQRSSVDFKNVHRNLTGQLSCSYTYNGSTQTDTQTLNVYHPATVENCSVDVSRHNWSAILSCNITQVFSSAGLYDFTVFWDTRGLMFGGRRSYFNGLTSYVNTSDNQVYYNGSLTYSWRLPHSPVRNPLVYSVYVYYGHTAFRQYLIKKETVVAPPDSPSTNCSELNYIPETGVVPCVCTADSLGSPPGRLLWLLGDTVMATGDYNVSQLQFPSGQVSRQHDGMVATCQVDWVQPTSTQFTLHLAYGPDSLSLQVNQTDDVTTNSTVYVISPMTSVKPKTSDMVQWGGKCQGQQGFTCTLTPSSAAEVDGKTVTCRVTNTANNGHSAEASVIIRQQRWKPDPSQVQTNIEMRLRYVLVTVCSRVTENQVETQVHARVVKENQDWPGLCLDSTCTNAHVTATCDGPLSKSITAIVKIERVPAKVTSTKSQASRSPRDVLFRAAMEENAFDLETLNAILDKTDILVKTLHTCTPGYTYTGSRCAPDPSQVQTDIDMRLRYVLVTVCSRVTENQVETQVHARVVKENQDWPGLCLDSTCTNAHVTATCDGPLSKSISAVVKIERVPAKVTSAKTQASRSPRDVLLQAAVEDNAFDLETLNAVLDKTDVLIRLLQTCTPGYTYTGSDCVKDEEPSKDSAVLIGSVIGGVFAFLVVVIFIVLVVVVLRRLGRLNGGRRLSSGRQKQADDHAYTTLHFDQRGPRGQQGALELRPQGFDLNNPSFNQQDERPVSDYDFIAEDNPDIAKHLAESAQVDAEPDYVPPDYPRDDYCTLRNSDITSLEHSQEDYSSGKDYE